MVKKEKTLETICFHDVSVCYDKTCVLHGISWEVPLGARLAIIGPNGAGKSTLLKSMMGFVPMHAGRIHYPGEIKPHMAYMPQKTHLDHHFPLTVGDVVTMGLYPQYGAFSRIPEEAVTHVREALRVVGMSGKIDTPLYALSGGQFQRILFARLWLQDAAVVLLDEPFSAIDTHTKYDLMALLQEWSDAGKTILTVLHDYELVKTFFPYAVLLARTCVAYGETHKVLTPENLTKAQSISEQWDTPSLGLDVYA
ncbi:MAG: metal ABC transporter ATP-binding protein [Alphaproteobacteria bacterium]|nr:MAG: metal ABC transporter ATP-binding protein [Alphaproteobacteria bacterium]